MRGRLGVAALGVAVRHGRSGRLRCRGARRRGRPGCPGCLGVRRERRRADRAGPGVAEPGVAEPYAADPRVPARRCGLQEPVCGAPDAIARHDRQVVAARAGRGDASRRHGWAPGGPEAATAMSAPGRPNLSGRPDLPGRPWPPGRGVRRTVTGGPGSDNDGAGSAHGAPPAGSGPAGSEPPRAPARRTANSGSEGARPGPAGARKQRRAGAREQRRRGPKTEVRHASDAVCRRVTGLPGAVSDPFPPDAPEAHPHAPGRRALRARLSRARARAPEPPRTMNRGSPR